VTVREFSYRAGLEDFHLTRFDMANAKWQLGRECGFHVHCMNVVVARLAV
jgi:hypothetical protein